MATAPQHNAQLAAEAPKVWVVYYGNPVYSGQLGLPSSVELFGSLGAAGVVPLPRLPGTAGFFAWPRERVAIVAGDPYYNVELRNLDGSVALGASGSSELGTLVNIPFDQGAALELTSGKDALLDRSSIAACRQFALENGIFGIWVETIRPKSSGDDDSSTSTGPDGTVYKSGVIDLTDNRYFMTADHHWHNRNHAGSDLGWACAPAQEPKHGVAGFVQGAANIASTGFADLLHNPLGTALLILVLVSAAPLGGLFLPAVEVSTVTATGIDLATHGQAGALDKLGSGAKFIAEHPAETGEAVAGAELVIAGAAVGGKYGKMLSDKLGGKILGAGLGALMGDAALAGTLPTTPSSPNTPGALLDASAATPDPWWRFFTRTRSK